MNAKTLKALNGSIKKWEKIVAGTGMDGGPLNCPLCQLFFWNTDCEGCPVMKRTGNWCCEGTPYDEWLDATTGLAEPPRLKAIARKELRFLRSLLPKKRP